VVAAKRVKHPRSEHHFAQRSLPFAHVLRTHRVVGAAARAAAAVTGEGVAEDLPEVVEALLDSSLAHLL